MLLDINLSSRNDIVHALAILNWLTLNSFITLLIQCHLLNEQVINTEYCVVLKYKETEIDCESDGPSWKVAQTMH